MKITRILISYRFKNSREVASFVNNCSKTKTLTETLHI